MLLLAERAGTGAPEIQAVELNDASELVELPPRAGRAPTSLLDHSTEKWTRYFLSPGELQLLRELEGRTDLRRLGDIAEVDVGVVTGDNDFFVLTGDRRENSNLRRW